MLFLLHTVCKTYVFLDWILQLLKQKVNDKFRLLELWYFHRNLTGHICIYHYEIITVLLNCSFNTLLHVHLMVFRKKKRKEERKK